MFFKRKYLRVVPGKCLEKVWVIPISGKCCRKIQSEKWKINPFFQFCSWHFQPSNRTKRLVSWPSSPLLTSNWARLMAGKYLVWFRLQPAAGDGWDDTWRWRGWARLWLGWADMWIISVPLDIVFLNQPPPLSLFKVRQGFAVFGSRQP